MATIVLSVLGFLAILGPLVIVHELGHYFFARVFGVKAEVFSIGFGPRLWGRRWGETEWRFSAVPLGGYVKLLGEEDNSTELPPELKKRTLHAQVPWKRFFIFFGGPLFNFLFAIVVFMAIILIGEPHIASVAGRVVPQTVAANAGLKTGDRIVAVDSKPVKRFEEILIAANENPEKPLRFEVVHPGTTAPVPVVVVPTSREGFSIYGESTQVGEVEGLYPNARSNQAGVSNPQSPAGLAGIQTGHKIIELNGTRVADWENLEEIYRELPLGAPFKVKVENEKEKAPQNVREITFSKPTISQSLGHDLGLWSSELFVEKAMPKSPAEVEGIKSGDRLVGIGGQEVLSFFALRDLVQASGEKDGKVTVNWERNGQRMSATVTPTASKGRDAALKKTTQYTIGVVPQLLFAEPATVIERTFNPFKLVSMATERMAVLTWRNLVSLRKMFTGDVSIGTLGGPILIGKIAGESIARGLLAFLTTMGILSVGLGILNVLPVPVLDGGHLMLLAIESVRGKPLSLRQMEIIQQVGLTLILALMVVVIRNDIARLPFFN